MSPLAVERGCPRGRRVGGGGLLGTHKHGHTHVGDGVRWARHQRGRGDSAARRCRCVTRRRDTQINVPPRSSEDEYYQACHAAKTWMQGRQGDRQALIEAYLAAVQAPGAVGAGTWNTPWAALQLARQAVIVAAKAAANDECG
jgi:Putative lipoprotein LpqV